MIPELDVYREHLERFRAVTLQVLDLVEDDDLAWRPSPDQYTLGQQLLHIGQAEDFQIRRLLEGDLDVARVRFPDEMPDRARIRAFLDEVLRRMGKTPPFFAAPLPPGERPDIDMREQLGEF